MDYSLNMREIRWLIKRNIKIVVVFAVVFSLTICIYQAHSISKKSENANLNQEKIATNNYSQWMRDREKTISNLENELVSAYSVLEHNPIMSISSDMCKRRSIVFTFEENREISRVATIKGWLDSLDAKSLFGIDSSIIEKYRNDLLIIEGTVGEVTITIYEVKEYDIDKVAKNVINTVLRKAKNSKINIIDYQNNRINGFSQSLFDKQDILRNDIIRVVNEINTLNNYNMDQPNKTPSAKNAVVRIIVFAFLGLAIGSLLSIVVLLFIAIRRGIIISSRQVNELFHLKNIGSIGESKEDIAVISAVINAIADCEKGIMVVSESENESYKNITNELNRTNDGRYIYGTIEMDSVKSVNNLELVDKGIIPVIMNKTTWKEIDRILKWSNIFHKDIIGYVVVEE